MANMIPDLKFASNTWIDLYAQTGFTVGTELLVVNKATNFDVLVWEGPTPPSPGTDGLPGGGVPLRYPDMLRIKSGASGAWAYYPNSSTLALSRVCVQQG